MDSQHTSSENLETIKDQTQASKMNLIQQLQSAINLSEILRILGACAVLVSMSLYLLNGWSEGNDLIRYYKLLAQTALLTLAGFSMSYLFKENKGARVFFGLSLISVAANFTILGALIYSIIQFDSHLIQYPSFVAWKVVDVSQFSLVAMAAIGFLMLVSVLSFRIFARQSAKTLTIAFFVLCSLLLLPVRSSVFIAILIIIGSGIALFALRRIYQSDNRPSTLEGAFANITLVIPIGIMLIRALSLYGIDSVLEICLASIVFCGLKFYLQTHNLSSTADNSLVLFKAVLGFFIAYKVSSLIPYSHNEFHLAVYSFLSILLASDTLSATNNKAPKNIIVITTSGFAALMCSVEVLLSQSHYSIITAIGVGVGIYIFAKACQNKPALVMAVITILAGASIGLFRILAYINLNSAIALGVTGALIIISASVIERYGVQLKLKFKTMLKA